MSLRIRLVMLNSLGNHSMKQKIEIHKNIKIEILCTSEWHKFNKK